jgi:hypothetical protein
LPNTDLLVVSLPGGSVLEDMPGFAHGSPCRISGLQHFRRGAVEHPRIQQARSLLVGRLHLPWRGSWQHTEDVVPRQHAN